MQTNRRITSTYKQKCELCNFETVRFYADHAEKLMCSSCYYEKHGNIEALSCLLPCRKCSPPEVHWYVRKFYGGAPVEDCGLHDGEKNEELK